MPSPQLVSTLKGLMAFRKLPDADLAKIIEMSEVQSLPAEHTFPVDGVRDAPWYLVISGRVRLYEAQGGQNRPTPGRLVRAGGFFGADHLLYGKAMRWEVKTMTDSQLLVIPAPALAGLLNQMPVFKDGLLATLRFDKVEKAHDFSWLGENEQVKLIVRQHQMFLVVASARPLLMALGSVLVILMGAGMPVASFGWAFIWIGAGLLIAALLWLVWQVIDWANDHYIVTDQRVVWLEQVLALYDSRHESLLSSIKSAEVKRSYWGRVFGFGDVIVYALMGQVKFANIANPVQVKALIDELQRATAVSTQREEVTAMEKVIRRKIDPPPAPPEPPPAPVVPPPRPARRLINLVPPENFFQFALREEKNNVISYRQHTIILLYRIWLPTLVEIGLAVGMVYLVMQNLAGKQTFPSIPTALLTYLLAAFLVGLWWLYLYMDWRDDRYQIAPDKLISSNRRPLGEEKVDTTNLGNILSMDYQRIGIIGLLFNFGNLEINTGSENKLVFQNIQDPSRAQMEIANYLFNMRRKQQLSEQNVEVERFSNMLAAYHRQAEDLRRTQKPE